MTTFSSIFISTVLFLFCFSTRAQAQTPIPVPAEFTDLYDELDSKLTSFEERIDQDWNGDSYPVIFSADLANANANRGVALLDTNTLAGIELTLDRLQALGIKGVKVSISYPILMSGIDTDGQYLEFYKNVATKVREHNMKLLVSMGHMFPGFSDISVEGYADTVEEYKAGRRTLAHLIAQEIRPDYLTIISEPSSETLVTGLDELNSPETQEEIARFVLIGLERGTPLRGQTKIGAGIGSWEEEGFVTKFGSIEQIDYIDLHMYPITTTVVDDFLENVLDYADIAHAHNKTVVIGEAWLYKTRTDELSLGAFNREIFGRDPYSFWQPLDQKYIRLLVKMSHYKEVEFTSVFWTQYLFSYIDYDDRTKALSVEERLQESAQKAGANILSNTFSSTGRYYGSLIIAQPSPTLACSRVADVDCDGAVNLVDLSMLLVSFGTGDKTRQQGDVNGDARVDLTDLSIVLANFGR